MSGWRIDANVILRHLTGTPADHADRARRLFAAITAGQIAVFLEDVILAEVVWTLTSHYKLPKPEVVEIIEELIAANGVKMHDKRAMIAALALWRNHRLKFVDAVFAARTLAAGQVDLWSFDREFDQIPGIQRHEPA